MQKSLAVVKRIENKTDERIVLKPLSKQSAPVTVDLRHLPGYKGEDFAELGIQRGVKVWFYLSPETGLPVLFELDAVQPKWWGERIWLSLVC